jgi:hypothetical protein
MMKIILNADDPENRVVLRYASDLGEAGIETDEDFIKLDDLGEDKFYVDNNPWFEVYSTFEDGKVSEPLYELDEAVALMIEWHEQETERE